MEKYLKKLKDKRWLYIIIFIVLVLSVFTHYKTGILFPQNIDAEDLEKWKYNKEGLILGQDSFKLDGDTGHCWLMVHSYTSTPSEMRETANFVKEKFGDYVSVPRLKGHSGLPSDLKGLSLKDWYDQIEKEYLEMNEKCGKISFVGSSIGGLMGLRLSEEKDLFSVYTLNSFFNIPYNFYYILKPEVYMEFLGPYFHFIKKNKTGQIADPTGREKHFAYLNMPLEPIINSKNFFLETKKKLSKIDEPILIVHSKNDPVSSFESVKAAYEVIPSDNKEFLSVSNSEHILLRDYDKWKIIDEIIDFEERLRAQYSH